MISSLAQRHEKSTIIVWSDVRRAIMPQRSGHLLASSWIGLHVMVWHCTALHKVTARTYTLYSRELFPEDVSCCLEDTQAL